MIKPIRGIVLLCAVCTALLLSACVTLNSPNSQLYTLSSSSENASAAPQQGASGLPVLVVGPVELPDYLRRPQIVTREGQNRIKIAEFDRWAAPLNEQVERVLAENLASRVPDMVVVNYREQRFKPSYRLTVTLERFERQDMKQVELAGRWTVANAESGEVVLTRRDRFSVPLEGSDYEATVAAQSKALSELAAAVSNALNDELKLGRPAS